MKKTLSLVLAAVMMVALILPAAAQSGGAKGSNDSAAYSTNMNTYTYVYGRWSKVINSYLFTNHNGGITRVESIGNRIFVEDYDSSYNFISGEIIDNELPIFGGFYSGANYNYLVFGQSNTAEDPQAEVVRIVKYSKNWQRLASASLYGENTYNPFEAGSLRMAESGNHLFIRTCHKMFASSDGLNHQANLTIVFDSSSDTVIDCFSRVANSGAGYVSHSFNQFIQVDGDRVVCADHGDAYPRGLIICRYNRTVGTDSLLQGGTTNAVPMTFPGSVGANDTGAAMGGFETTSVGYMIAGNANPESLSSAAQRNIFLTVTPRDGYPNAESRTVWLTNYESGVAVSIPHLVKVNNNKLVVIWTEDGVAKYVFVDGNGDPIGDIVTDANMKVSDCQPILDGDRVLWYVTNSSQPMFYYISVGSDPTPGPTPDPTPTPTDAPPISGGMVADKSVRLEADGTYSIVYSAYSTGTEHGKWTRIYENRITVFDKDSDFRFSYKYYKCMGMENGEYVFVPTDDQPASLMMSSSSTSSYFSYNIGGFAFNENICYPYGGGYKLEVTVSGLKLKDTVASGSYPTGSSSYIGYSGLENVNFPQTTITVGNRTVPYDFGTELAFSYDDVAEVLSIDSGYPQYTLQDGAYLYNTSMPDASAEPTYNAVITDGTLKYKPFEVTTGTVAVNALVRLTDGGCEWTKLSFIPAATVLYEEDFVSFTSGSDGATAYDWSVSGTPRTAAQTAGGVFGYDASYALDSTDSNGSAMKITVDAALSEAIRNRVDGAAWPMAEFTFAGTGIDVYSRCGVDTGVIAVDLVPVNMSYSYTGSGSVHMVMDTYSPGDTLYQLPVLHMEGLAYDHYKLRIRAIYSNLFDHQGSSSTVLGSTVPGLEENVVYEFVSAGSEKTEGMRAAGSFTTYIDAIRIYNPLGNITVPAYAAANEQGAQYKNVRRMLRTMTTAEANTVLNIGIDSETRTVKATDYDSISPRNEVYIRNNMGVGFNIEGSYAAVHLSVKSPTGDGFLLKINDRYLLGDNGEPLVIRHTSELYYDITEYLNGSSVTLLAESADGSHTDPVLSIVTLKLIPAATNGSFEAPCVVASADLIEFAEAIHFGVIGDADHSGVVSVMDALAVMRFTMGSVELGVYGGMMADANGDGRIDLADALAIMRIVLKIA